MRQCEELSVRELFGSCPVFVRHQFGLYSMQIRSVKGAFMDRKFEDILDTLPEKPPRSRLEPYRELIGELRKRGRTYRDIAGILAEKCQLRVSVSRIHDFARVPLRAKRKQASADTRISAAAVTLSTTDANAVRQAGRSTDEARQRIAAVKLRPAPGKVDPQQFRYDPGEPLHLSAKTSQGRSRKR